jgi:hypothetical protein
MEDIILDLGGRVLSGQFFQLPLQVVAHKHWARQRRLIYSLHRGERRPEYL